jgi:hypothetical protein
MTGYCLSAIRSAGAITPELLEAISDALEQLLTELEQQLFPMHFGLSVGRHRCVSQLHQEAIARLRCLAAIAKPEAPPPPPPEPLMTLADVVAAFGEPIQPSDDATYIGTDEDEQYAW